MVNTDEFAALGYDIPYTYTYYTCILDIPISKQAWLYEREQGIYTRFRRKYKVNSF